MTVKAKQQHKNFYLFLIVEAISADSKQIIKIKSKVNKVMGNIEIHDHTTQR